MRKIIRKIILSAFAVMPLINISVAEAQYNDGVYFTPKIIYSHQKADMTSTKWNGGGILIGEENDGRFGFGLAAGLDMSYATGNPIRLELEYAYHGGAEFSKGPKTYTVGSTWHQASQEFNIKTHSLMANIFYDFNVDGNFTPYIGGGLGTAYVNTKYKTETNRGGVHGAASLSKKDWNLAWNLGGGVAIHLKDNVALDLAYRYYDFGKSEPGSFNIRNLSYSGNPSLDLNAHELSVGIRFSGF